MTDSGAILDPSTPETAHFENQPAHGGDNALAAEVSSGYQTNDQQRVIEPHFGGGLHRDKQPSFIDVKAIEPYRGVIEAGGQYDKNSSVVLLWASHLPQRYSGTDTDETYAYKMDHILR